MDDKDAAVTGEPTTQEPDSATNASSAKTFLSSLSEMLKTADNTDVHLTDILAEHLLVSAPHSNAVANAKSAIIAIAEKRAAPAQDATDE